MLKRAALKAILILALALALVACEPEDDPVIVAQMSPPLPPPARVELVELSAAKLGVGSITPPPRCVSAEHQPGGKPVTVNLEDPGGSGKYLFAPSPLSFKVGEAVNFTLTGETEPHTFTIDELDIDCSVDAGETVTFSFTFDEADTYRLYCIPHWSLGMETKITVQ